MNYEAKFRTRTWPADAQNTYNSIHNTQPLMFFFICSGCVRPDAPVICCYELQRDNAHR